jgi:hypothetical protein
MSRSLYLRLSSCSVYLIGFRVFTFSKIHFVMRHVHFKAQLSYDVNLLVREIEADNNYFECIVIELN